MTVTILLFARAREIAGQPRIQVNVPAGATVADVREALAGACTGLREVLPWCQFAVDQQYAADDEPVSERNEIGCIPPVSGG